MGTFMTGIALGGIIAAIISKMIREKKRGKALGCDCSCGCGECPHRQRN